MKPGDTCVMAVMAVMIVNGDGDGEKKQDRELTAARRWLKSHQKEYRWLKPTLLGDDLYSHEPFCRQIREAGYIFIFTREDATHP